MTVITTSRTELSRLRLMIDLTDCRTRMEDAAALLGLRRRQIYRLLDALSRTRPRHTYLQAPWPPEQPINRPRRMR
jgi:hypothetical protein